MSIIKNIILIGILLGLIACTSTQKNDNEKLASKIEVNSDNKEEKTTDEFIIYNLEILQEMYAGSNSNIFNEKTQKKIDKYYTKKFFDIWERKEAKVIKTNIEKILNRYKENPGYAENKQERDNQLISKIEENMNLLTYPNYLQNGIVLRKCNIRALPSEKPHYYDFNKAGEGYPFDNFQVANLYAGYPVLITHKSKDGSWFYVENIVAEGWVHSKNIAFVDEKFIRRWKTGKYAALISDNVPVNDSNGIFRFEAGIGSFFPIKDIKLNKNMKNIRENKEYWFGKEEQELEINKLSKERSESNPINKNNDKLEIFIVSEDENKNAIMKTAKISKDVAVEKPYKFNHKNMIRILEELHNENYGWGGLHGNRDCSGMVRDIFVPFGMILPKYSYSQATKDDYIILENLDKKSKLEFIKNNAKPFSTLLYKYGHVMLYVGSYNNDILVFHNVWGIKTIDQAGKEGRHLIGKAILSSIEFDKNISNRVTELLDDIIIMNDVLPTSPYKYLIDFED